MELRVERLGDGITRAVPVGRWDVVGAMSIDLQLSVIAGSGRSVIVDLSEVTFLSSMGIRTIITSAKAIASHGARMVLLSPCSNVREVLTTTGIDTLVPIYEDLAVAHLAVVSG